jgi:hypothetical protein
VGHPAIGAGIEPQARSAGGPGLDFETWVSPRTRYSFRAIRPGGSSAVFSSSGPCVALLEEQADGQEA